MKKYIVFNDEDGMRQFMEDAPVELDPGLEVSGDRELRLVDDFFLDMALATPTDVDYVVEERE